MEQVKGLVLPNKPIIPSDEIRNLCSALMEEEVDETIAAMIQAQILPRSSESLVEVIDGLCDTLYVVLYTCNAYGIDIEPFFDEVQRSNMTKKGGPKAENGKQLKGLDYSPPDLYPILVEQIR